MTYIFLPDGVDIKTYNATAKFNQASIVRIDLVCKDPNSLGYLLEKLEEAVRSQQAKNKAALKKSQLKVKERHLIGEIPHKGVPPMDCGDDA